jgi:signal transduction histidine kinase
MLARRGEMLLSDFGVFDPFLEELYLKVVEIGRKASRAKDLVDEIENRINRENIIPSTVRVIRLLTKGALEFLSPEKRPSRFKFLVHDLKGLLSVISMRTSLVEKYLQGEDYKGVKNSLVEMEKASSRSGEMITDANRKIVKGEGEDVLAVEGIETNLEKLIRSAFDDMAINQGSSDVGLYIDVNPMTIRKCGSDLYRVFMNIMGNAYEAMTKKVYEDGGPSLKIFSSIVEKRTLRVEFEDNGPGMTQAVSQMVFEEGFSTKEKKGDKGLGLYYCRRIISKMGGDLSVKSVLGKKTIVIFEIPLEAIQ